MAVRERICKQAEFGHRDALMMDCALENWFMTKMTESDKGSIDRGEEGRVREGSRMIGGGHKGGPLMIVENLDAEWI